MPTEKPTSDAPSARPETIAPFGVHFEQVCRPDDAAADTVTTSMSDDDTGTYRAETDEHDT